VADVDHHRGSPPLGVRLAISWLTNALVLGRRRRAALRSPCPQCRIAVGRRRRFGVLNTVLKPLLRFVTLPLAILSLGIAWFFVSMLMLAITTGIVSGFAIHGFWTLVDATLVVWLVNLVLDFLPGPWQVTGKRQRRKRG
jgi:putative membrane protein